MNGRNRFGFFLAGLMLLVPLSSESAVRYVALASYFGTNPAAPYTDLLRPANLIQDALGVAQAGDTVLVAGIPAERVIESGWSYVERIRIPRGVVLLGGWDYRAAAAGSPSVNQRVFAVDSLWTTIAPLEAGVAVAFRVDSTKVYDTTDVGGSPVIDSSWVLIGPDSATVFSGFVVRGSNNTTGEGSALFLRSGSPSIRYNLIVDSRATGRGGAIFLGNGSPRVEHNTIALTLSAPWGGSIHIAGGSPIIRDNIIYSTAVGFGIACSDSAGAPVVSHNIFFENVGSDINGCAAGGVNYFGRNPVFCDILNADYRIYQESPIQGLASDGSIPGAWGIGCRAGTKYVSASGNEVFPYDRPARAARSLDSVLAIASRGDTIRLSTGTYRQNIEMVPGIVLEGGWDNLFISSPWGKTAQVAYGTVFAPEDTDSPALRFSSGGSDTTRVSFLVLTGAVSGDGALLDVDSGRVEIRHLSVLENKTPEVFGSLIRAGDGGEISVRYGMFAHNEGLPVFDCEGNGSISVESSNFYLNDLEFAPGCAAAVSDTTHKYPFFCDPENGDFRVYQEGGLGEAAPGLRPFGALSVGCYYFAHYVHPDSGAGVFPYETPEHATSDIQAVLDLAERGDTVRFAEGLYETNLVLTGGEYLEGGWEGESFSTRDPFLYPSILSGVAAGEPTVRTGGRYPQFSTAGGLNGFVLKHSEGVDGPGLVVGEGSRPAIRNCLIRDNRVDFAAHPEHPAAGVVVKGTSATIQAVGFLVNNTIVGNRVDGATAASTAASGVYMENAGYGSTDRMRFRRNIVAYNSGARAGLVVNENDRDLDTNYVYANLDAEGASANIAVLAGAPLPAGNRQADPIFCDPASGEWALSTCSPAIKGATGDTVIGALPISEECVCENEVFLVNPLAPTPGFPFRSRQNASRTISRVTPYLSAGDTVKVSVGTVNDRFDLVGGVVYKGGYNVNNYNEAERGRGASRVTANSAARIMRADAGVDSTTLIDGFTFAGGRADSGAVVLLRGDASPLFSNNVFQESRGDRTGGILLSLDESRPSLVGNMIQINSADDEGGIIHLAGAGGLIAGNTITDNRGGAWAIFIEDCAPVIYNNLITWNSNGLYAVGDSAAIAGTVFDHNNVFRHNVDYDEDFLRIVDTTGLSNVSLNPLYCDRGRRVFTLFDHSPVVFAGRNGGRIGARGVGCSTPVHYVSADGSNSYPYATREAAAHRVQDALDVALLAGLSNPADSIDEVRVAGGVYDGAIRMPTNVRLLGGYSADFATRDVDGNTTEIRGDGSGTTVGIDSGVVGVGLVQTTIEGFTISGGGGEEGGGIRVGKDGRPTIRDNKIRDCMAILGGGIFVDEGALPTIELNLMVRDTAEAGAGIYVRGREGFNSNLMLLRSNTYVFNHASVDTAVVVHLEDANPRFQNSIVAYSSGGGGLFHEGQTNPTVRNNLFYGNVGGDSLPAHLTPGTHLIARPDFCDSGADLFGILYDADKINAGESAIRDLCALTVWGSEGVGCTRPGHRFLVFSDPNRIRTPVFPYVCAANSARMLASVLGRVNPGDTVDVAGSALPTGARYEGNYVLTKPIVLRGGFDPGFVLEEPFPDSANLWSVLLPSAVGPILTVRQDSAAATDPSLVIDSTALISGFTFMNGTAVLRNGGAIRCVNGAAPMIRNNVFEENRSKNWGGAIAVERANSPRIYDNYFYRNAAGIGGGLYLFETFDPVVRGNIFSANGAKLYGGIRVEGTRGGGSIDNNVFFQNSAGAVSVSESQGDLVIRNNAVVSNGGHGIALAPVFEGIGKPILSHNDVWANTAGNYLNLDPGDGDIHENPQFCNTRTRVDVTTLQRTSPDFFRYQECSPLLYAGSDTLSSLDAHIGVASLLDPTCADTVRPVLSVGFVMHSTIPNVANLFVVPSEAIARDSVQLLLMYADAKIESIIVGDNIIEVTVYRFDSTEVDLGLGDPGLSIYRSGNIELRTADTLIVQARAVDLCGRVGTVRRNFSSGQFVRGTPGKMWSVDRRLRLDAPAGSFAASGVVITEGLDAESFASTEPPLAGPYRLLVSQIRPVAPLAVSMGLDGLDLEAKAKSGVALYRWGPEGWAHIESRIDPDRNEMVAGIQESGTYAVFYSSGVKSEEVPPRAFALHGNKPNPFNPATRIAFDLPTREDVSLRIFDVRGREVRTLVSKTLPPGRYEYSWDGADNAGRRAGSGVYFYRVVAGEHSATRKMTLVR
ncbi:MAG: right-handed parallel beta-helix repeat-containing protein [Candidatus Eisenbacteria bacterium]